MKSTKNSLIPYYKKIDLSNKEIWREYKFPGGEIVRIENPQFLIVSDNGHRIGAGTMSHYIPYGWIELKWFNKGDRTVNFYCEKSDKEENKIPRAYLTLDSVAVTQAIRNGVRDIDGLDIFQVEGLRV